MTTKELGKLIHTRRAELGLTQVQLAKLMRCAQSHVSYLEVGRRRASRRDLMKLAKHLQLPIQDLVFGVDSAATQ